MLKVRDVMSSEVISVSPELPLRDLVGLFDDRHISGAPVVSNGRIVGVVSASDLLAFEAATPGVPAQRPEQQEWELEPVAEWEEGEEAPGAYFSEWWADAGADVAERFRETREPEWDVLAEHVVGEIMSTSACTIRPEADAAAAAAYMLRAGVHRLLVTEGARLLGIISAMDIVRAVAERRL